MRVTVELTYDMARRFGEPSFDVDDVDGVAELIAVVVERLGGDTERQARHAAIAINGVLVNHRQGRRTRLQDGDVVSFVVAGAGG